jgi:hypothetical protein
VDDHRAVVADERLERLDAAAEGIEVGAAIFPAVVEGVAAGAGVTEEARPALVGGFAVLARNGGSRYTRLARPRWVLPSDASAVRLSPKCSSP